MINPNETSAVLLQVDERKVATVIFNRPGKAPASEAVPVFLPPATW